MYGMHWSLFLILFATMCLSSYTCCAAGQTARSSDPSFLERHNYPEPRIRRPYTHKKHGVIFRQGGKSCGAFHGRGDSPFVYPLMTLPVCRLVIILSFTSIARTLREEFASRQKRLDENMYIDLCPLRGHPTDLYINLCPLRGHPTD